MYKFKEDLMRVPCYVWAEQGSIEQGAIEQIKNVSSLPFTFHHTVLCPDAHKGYGAPIGGVFASKGVVIVNFVGVDIGCGMCSLKTSLTEISTEQLKAIMGFIREKIPVGFGHHKEKQDENLMPVSDVLKSNQYIISKEYQSALYQLGTLGGGNHFIEIQKGSDGYIWIMIHSGSRNLGKKVADYYNKIAVRLNQMWFSEVDKSKELAFLPIETNDAKNYMIEMNYCVEFALASRKLMMENIKTCFNQVLNTTLEYEPIINIAHNYAKFENHFNTNVLIHRKGATSAKVGEIGIIPCSQGTKSYIVEGLGNVDSFTSCSHGAGRKMGRGAAIKNLNLEQEIEFMNKQGIIHGIRNASDLDEAAGAYKDGSIVMENQKDLVKILIELKPLGVIKG